MVLLLTNTKDKAQSKMPSHTKNLRADKATMEQMALRTGGKALHYTEVSKLADLIKQNQNLKPVVDFKKNKKPLLDWWWVLAGILGLLAVEWVIRKWYSML